MTDRPHSGDAGTRVPGTEPKRPKVVESLMTCEACPSQWELKFADGRMGYIRYRWGWLSVRVSEKPTSDVYDAVGGSEIFGEECGDYFDGLMGDAEMRNRTANVFDWPAAPSTGAPDHE